MAQTLSELLARVDELISDPRNQKFPKAAKVRALNTVLQDLISSRIMSYVRSADVQFRDGERTYDFPEDMLEPIGITFQDLTGQVMANSSWRGLVGNLTFSSNAPYDSEIFWQNTAQNGGKFILRDVVPDNQFIVTPAYAATDEGSSVVSQATMPTSATSGQIWVDTLDDENLVYRASGSYSTPKPKVLVVDGDNLSNGVDLTFTAGGYPFSVNMVSIAIVYTGAPGSCSRTMIGAADPASPVVITFYLTSTENSNDHLIALAATTGIVTASGSDSTNGTPLGLGTTEMFSEDNASITIPSELLAGSTDLTLYALRPGIVNIKVELLKTTGSASYACTGSGTRSDPYVVTLSVPTTASSNNDIIALCNTAPTIRVYGRGSDSTDGDFLGMAASDLDNPASQYWTPQYIHIMYNAIYPKLYNDTDELDPSIHVLIREGDCIPLMAAVKLLRAVRGDQRMLIMMSQYKSDYEDIIDRVRGHRALGGPPNDLEPV